MKKLLLSLFAILSFTFFVTAETATFDFSNPSQWGYSGTSEYDSSKPIFINDVTIDVDTKDASTGGGKFRLYNNQDFRCSKNGSVKNQTLTFSADGNTITKIEFTGTVNLTADCGNLTDKTWTGSAEKIVFTTTDSGANTFTKIEVTYEISDKTATTLTWSESEATVTLGQAFTAPTLTKDPADLAVTYTSSNPEVATINADGNVTPLADGTTEITASFAGDDTYKASSAKYTLTVIDPNKPAPTEVSLNTTKFGFASGYTTKSYTDPESNITFVGNATSSNGIALQKSGGYIVITANPRKHLIESVSFKAKQSGTKDTKLTVKKQDTAYPEPTAAQITNWSGTEVESIAITTKDDVLSYNTTKSIESPYIVLYNSTSNGQIQISELTIKLKAPTDKVKPILSFSQNEYKVFEGTEEIETPTLTVDPAEAADKVVYSSSDDEIAMVEETGEDAGYVLLTGKPGTVTITALIAEDDTYMASEASYTITVMPFIKNMKEFNALEDGQEAKINCDLTVLYAKNSYIYVEDENHNAGLVYDYNLNAKAGDVIKAGWMGKMEIHNGLPEIKLVSGETPTIETAEKPFALNLTPVPGFTEEDINKIIKLEDIAITATTTTDSNNNETTTFTAEIAGETINIYNGLKIGAVPDDTYNMIAAVSYYQKAGQEEGVLQLYPISFELSKDKHAIPHFATDEESYTQADGINDLPNGEKEDTYVMIKFEKGEGHKDDHKVYFRYTATNNAEDGSIRILTPGNYGPAKVRAKAGEENVDDTEEVEADPREGYIEYDFEKPAQFGEDGTLEYYTEHATSGIRSAVNKVQFSGVSGIEDIMIDAATGEAEYYNLQGVRVAEPAAGTIYIVRRAGKVTKELVK